MITMMKKNNTTAMKTKDNAPITQPHPAVADDDPVRERYRMAPKVIVAGSRGFDDYAMMHTTLSDLFNNNPFFAGKLVKVISGMAPGADTLAIRYADEHQLPKILMPPCWPYDKRRAGIFRNEDMVSIADAVVAFWDGQSHGTLHTIETAKAHGLPVWVYELKMGK